MFVKRVKRKCDVRACKNKDCFAISKSREIGNTIIACKDCLVQALDAINKLPAEEPKKKSSGIPPLFFNTQKKVEEQVIDTAENVDASEDKESDITVDAPDADTAEGDAVYSDQELLEGMTIKELRAFADEIGVDVSKCKVKADFVKVINTATSAEM